MSVRGTKSCFSGSSWTANLFMIGETHNCHLFLMSEHNKCQMRSQEFSDLNMGSNAKKTGVIGNMENTISPRGMSGTLRRDLWGASCSIWGHPDTKHKLVITLCPLGLLYETWLTGFFHSVLVCFFYIWCGECFQSCMHGSSSTKYYGKSTSLLFPLWTCFWLGGLLHNMETKWQFSNGN